MNDPTNYQAHNSVCYQWNENDRSDDIVELPHACWVTPAENSDRRDAKGIYTSVYAPFADRGQIVWTASIIRVRHHRDVSGHNQITRVYVTRSMHLGLAVTVSVPNPGDNCMADTAPHGLIVLMNTVRGIDAWTGNENDGLLLLSAPKLRWNVSCQFVQLNKLNANIFKKQKCSICRKSSLEVLMIPRQRAWRYPARIFPDFPPLIGRDIPAATSRCSWKGSSRIWSHRDHLILYCLAPLVFSRSIFP